MFEGLHIVLWPKDKTLWQVRVPRGRLGQLMTACIAVQVTVLDILQI